MLLPQDLLLPRVLLLLHRLQPESILRQEASFVLCLPLLLLFGQDYYYLLTTAIFIFFFDSMIVILPMLFLVEGGEVGAAQHLINEDRAHVLAVVVALRILISYSLHAQKVITIIIILHIFSSGTGSSSIIVIIIVIVSSWSVLLDLVFHNVLLLVYAMAFTFVVVISVVFVAGGELGKRVLGGLIRGHGCRIIAAHTSTTLQKLLL